jgi:WD40 repeat protein/serine/threonine protein kinase
MRITRQTPHGEHESAVTAHDERDPVERLAEDFLERLRRGERPAVEQYVERHPDLADRIRELFSALVLVEDAKPRTIDAVDRFAESPRVRDGQPVERLGDYRIVREIGRGGMGVVYEAEQESLGRRVALKILAPWAAGSGQTILRFHREARSAAQLHHANIVPVYAVGEHEGLHYYAMQLIAGLGLDQVLEEVKRLRRRSEARRVSPDDTKASVTELVATLVQPNVSSGALAAAGEARSVPPSSSAPDSPNSPIGLLGPSEETPASDLIGSYCRSVAQIGVQAAAALEYAHGQGMLHRDIKPSNLLLDAQGTIWVTDFGLAKATEDDDLTRTGDVVGTLRYMAPERFKGRCDARADTYAVGLTLYELLALRPAFEAADRHGLIHRITQSEPSPLRKIEPQIPRDLETIVHKAIEKDPADRYASAGRLADDLRRWLEHQPIQARPSGPVERLAKWSRRNPALAWLTLVSILTALVLLVTVSVGYVHVARALQRERQTSYFQRIALAERAWSSHDVGRAEQWLDACVPDFRGWEWHYLKRLCHANLLDLRVHQGLQPSPVAFSPDGATFAAAGDSGVITLRDSQTGRVLQSLRGHSQGVHGVAYSPDGRRLASAGQDRTIRVWDLETGRTVLASEPYVAEVLCVAFSPDGSQLALGCGTYWELVGPPRGPGALAIRDARTGQTTFHLAGLAGSVHRVAFAPDGTRLAVAGGDGQVTIRDTRTGVLIRRLAGHSDVVMGVCYSPDGRTLASAGLDGTLRLWDSAQGTPLAVIRETGERFLDLGFSPDGRRLAAGGRSWVVSVWDAAAGTRLQTYRGQDREVTGVAFSPDGRRLASAGYGGLVLVWDAARSQDALTIHESCGPAPALRVALDPTGRRIAVVSEEGLVCLRDAATGAAIGSMALADPGGPHAAVAFSPDGTRLAVGDGDSGKVAVCDARDGRTLETLPGHSDRVNALAFAPDGRRLATGDREGTVRVWDLTERAHRLRFVLRTRWLAVTSLAFAPDGRALAAGYGDVKAIALAGRATIWDMKKGTVLRELRGHRGGVSDVAYSPDGQRLATASWDRTVRVWNPTSGAVLHTLEIRGLLVWAVAFSPDGLRLVAADNIGRMIFWDAASGQEVLTVRGHSDRIYDLAFSADGRLLASASRDGSVRVWDATPLDTARSTSSR